MFSFACLLFFLHLHLHLHRFANCQEFDQLEIAVNGEGLLWAEIPNSELTPLRGSGARRYSAHYTHLYVPVLYDADADKYGITSEQVRNAYFEIYLRKFQWTATPSDERKPTKHVLLVSGGPGESGDSWVQKMYDLFLAYGKGNVIFYVADHRGVYKSSGVVELRRRGDRRSWRKIGPSERVKEAHWQRDVIAFEESAGFPVVAMSCTNAAKDLALITRVLKHYAIPRSSSSSHQHQHQFFIHAQSYGTMVALRTLHLLPEAFEAVLLEGLASLEMVDESVKADYGLLQACDDDPVCRKQIRVPEAGIESAFDVRKMIRDVSKHSRNAPCRSHLHRQLAKHLYSPSTSFSDALQTLLYELMTDDFAFDDDDQIADRYAGMLALPFLKNLYFCHDEDKFRAQTQRLIKIVRSHIRGIDKARMHSHQHQSHSVPDSLFVRAYINVHEAYDLRAMRRNGYCQQAEFEDLGHQCVVYRAQVKAMEALKALTGRSDRFSPASSKINTAPSVIDLRREAVAQDLKQSSRRVSLSELQRDKAEEDDEHEESSSSDDDDDANDHSHPKHKFIFKAHHRHAKHKHHSKAKRKHKKEISKFLGVKKDKSHGSKSHGSEVIIPITDEEYPSVGSTVLGKRRYYYDLDHLAYTQPSTSARIYVIGGTLDMKTPSNTARRLLDAIRTPQKHFFEVEKVGHNTRACQAPIIRAFLEGRGVGEAERCLQEFKEKRKLDWTFSGEEWW